MSGIAAVCLKIRNQIANKYNIWKLQPGIQSRPGIDTGCVALIDLYFTALVQARQLIDNIGT